MTPVNPASRTFVTLVEMRADNIYRFIEGRGVHVGAIYEHFGHRWTPAKTDRALRALVARGLVVELDGLLIATADVELAA